MDDEEKHTPQIYGGQQTDEEDTAIHEEEEQEVSF